MAVEGLWVCGYNFCGKAVDRKTREHEETPHS